MKLMQQNWHEPGVLRPEPRPLLLEEERAVASEAQWKARLWETLKDQDPWGCAACRANKDGENTHARAIDAPGEWKLLQTRLGG
jgi:hypothetical protein